MEYLCFRLGELQTNCYLIWSDTEAGVIDPGGASQPVVEAIESRGLTLKWIVNTHGHADHIAGNGELIARYGVPLMIHPADRPMLLSAEANLSVVLGPGLVSPDASETLTDGSILTLGQEKLTVLATPGHTPGGISIYTEGLLFSGDTLFFESVGRTDLPGGDFQVLITGICEKLLVLPSATTVLPGHERSTTIEHEQQFNPYLNCHDAF